jgi:D-beta-D-heptose 7-phosphate kinase/D-beta-D-heptose 1-phosphate adenosyltransferase
VRKIRAKILSGPEAARAVSAAQRRGEKVVFTSGCFDLLHVGHLRSLEEARSYGDRLVVAVNSDASVRNIKGPGRPIIPMRQRVELLASLECVDWVTSFRGRTPRSMIGALNPDVYAKGGEWPLETLLAQDVPAAGWSGEVKRLRQIPGIRTSEIVERIRRKRGASPKRPRRPAGAGGE